MADQSAQPKPTLEKKLLGYARTGGRSLILALAGRTTRWTIMVIAILAIGWLMYGNVAQTLSQPVQLPVGVTPNNPELDSNALTAINNARIDRTQFQFKTFAAFDSLFVPVVTATPIPLP